MSHAPFNTAFAHGIVSHKYMAPHGETHWSQTARRVTDSVADALLDAPDSIPSDVTALKDAVYPLINDRRFIPGGRYLYAAGNDLHQVQNCLLLRAEDTREGWADLSHKAFMSLMTGAGIGAYYGALRPAGSLIKRTGGKASGPVPLAKAINEMGRAAVQGGDRRAAIWGGLPWWHADVFDWMTAKQWPQWLREQKAKDFNVPAPLDMTNISVCLDDAFFYFMAGAPAREPWNKAHDLPEFAPDGSDWVDWAKKVYWACIDLMTTTGEPGFSVDLGDKRNEQLRNACTEVTSEDDSDICNLGGLVLSRFESPRSSRRAYREFEDAVMNGVAFLTAGSLYSDVPYAKVDEIRTKNRRLGLDVMGVHEVLLRAGVKYGTPEAFEVLDPYMEIYDRALEFANEYQEDLGISHSVAATAGSPTGTRAAAVAESTTAWEPATYAAYKRAVITASAGGDTKAYTYVVDPTIKRLVEEGVLSYDSDIEDSASLAYDYEKRFAMQAYAQSHTDQAISMTVNLPYVMKDAADRKAFGETLLPYLPKLRGMTVYPDGAIPGQPIISVPLAEALANEGNLVIEEDVEKCASGVCGV